MTQRFRLRSTERMIVSVTPSPQGLVGPLVAVAILVFAIVETSHFIETVAHYQQQVFVLLVGPAVIVALTRTWRWRSMKIVVTSEQIVMLRGVVRRTMIAIALDSVVTVSVHQRLRDRLTRKGTIGIETLNQSLTFGPLRHPGALVRLIEQARRDQRVSEGMFHGTTESPNYLDRWGPNAAFDS